MTHWIRGRLKMIYSNVCGKQMRHEPLNTIGDLYKSQTSVRCGRINSIFSGPTSVSRECTKNIWSISLQSDICGLMYKKKTMQNSLGLICLLSIRPNACLREVYRPWKQMPSSNLNQSIRNTIDYVSVYLSNLASI